ncbi:glutathione S-transferase 1-1-like [Hylaeus anthracinus]|uniref:glutathione S-transferase 1-1-like n=1 Tax=Hylaeus volcanicus TaxID=313075 RepID=UPI0023B80197|nr:glutathione S-transferase 1-1-like [Hylaeus volcanicus]XP_053977097.1 glutathione S-transferase 1-1-like [Hylaeus volcanicus]XP_053977098.1 glutathione S-transferase 1-1-like [Hylaeus volcanicus]XP_054015685.1 glutathione S-transferase 1-1-like [Hylaeus anthracinus]XP_054015687.1 glutathione S-transferase 1-1-like [Hylaeus anthracinus]
MPIDIYYHPCSAPCRSVALLAKAIGVHLNIKTLNFLINEHMTPSFLKINPQHTLPTMDDNGFILCESRPIMGYLVNKYAKNDSLYPNDPKKRGKVDEMLYFDIGVLYDSITKCYFPVVLGKRNTLLEEDVQAVETACELLNTFLEDREFVAGDTLTIADFSISATICLVQIFGFDIGRYDNVAAWYNRCTEVLDKFGYEEVHSPGRKIVADMYWPNLQESN